MTALEHDHSQGAFDDVLAANQLYRSSYVDTGMAGQAARGLAVVTCMDSRIDPLALLGLGKGDAKIMRNAGARVTEDVLRTLVLAVHLLNVSRIMIMPHTDCAMSKITEAQAHEAMWKASGIDTRSIEIRTTSDRLATLALDVQRVRSSPYLPKGLSVVGCVYDVKTGGLQVAVPA